MYHSLKMFCFVLLIKKIIKGCVQYLLKDINASFPKIFYLSLKSKIFSREQQDFLRQHFQAFILQICTSEESFIGERSHLCCSGKGHTFRHEKEKNERRGRVVDSVNPVYSQRSCRDIVQTELKVSDIFQQHLFGCTSRMMEMLQCPDESSTLLI